MSLLELKPAKILRLRPEEVDWSLSNEEIEAIFAACQAGWKHPDLEHAAKSVEHPEIAHVRLRSGLHSGVYFNCPVVLERTNLCGIMGMQIVHRLSQAGVSPEGFQWVVGSATAATGLSYEVARILGKKWHPLIKHPDRESKKQLWEKKVIPPGEVVMDVEDLTTTTETPLRVREAIREGNPHPVEFFQVIPVLLYRPAASVTDDVVEDSQILWVLRFDVPNYELEVCPYCQAGSELVTDPKKEWVKLTGQKA